MATTKERMNLYMSEGLKAFYTQLAEEMGVTTSACMVMALKSYMDAQKGIQMGTDLKAMLKQLQEMQQVEGIQEEAQTDKTKKRKN